LVKNPYPGMIPGIFHTGTYGSVYPGSTHA